MAMGHDMGALLTTDWERRKVCAGYCRAVSPGLVRTPQPSIVPIAAPGLHASYPHIFYGADIYAGGFVRPTGILGLLVHISGRFMAAPQADGMPTAVFTSS